MVGDPASFRAILPAPDRIAKQRTDDISTDENGYSSSPVSSQRKLLKRIRSVAQACQMCRQMKAKCDGGRPRCGNCIDRDRPCGYEGEAGQSRQAAMRARLAAYESVFASLRTAPPADAEKMMQRMRTIEDPVIILREGGDNISFGNPSSSSPMSAPLSALASGQPSSVSATSANTLQTSPGFSPETSPRGSPPASPSVEMADSSPRQSVSLLLNSDADDLHFGFNSQHHGHGHGHSHGQQLPIHNASAAPLVAVAVELVFPSYASTRRAVAEFYMNRNPLLHVFSEDEAQTFVNVVFDASAQSSLARPSTAATAKAPAPPSPAAATADEKKIATSCLAGIVAVGMRHAATRGSASTDPSPPPTTFDRFTCNAVYDIAKHHFELILETSPLLAAKLTALLALFNIMSRNTIASIWIGIGMKLCRSWGLPSKTPADPNMPMAEWNKQRRIWRTLVFLSSWLAFATCSITGQEADFEPISPSAIEFEPSPDIRERLQSEFATISVLTAENLRIHLAFKSITVPSFESAIRDLQGWYAKLPASIHLANLPGSSGSNINDINSVPFPPDVLRSIHHLHLLYLGAILLTYRRMTSQYSSLFHEQQQQQHSIGHRSEAPESVPIDLLRQGIDAARTSAAICATVHQMGRDSHETGGSDSSSCWIVTLQAYSACIVLLHIVAQKQTHGCHWETWQDDLQRADVCIQILAAAGGMSGSGSSSGSGSGGVNSDPQAAAQELHGQVYPFFQTLSQATPSPFEVSAEAARARAHFNLHGRPGPSSRPGQEGLETSTLLLTLPMGAPLERTQMPLDLMAMVGRPFRSLGTE
ncbi:nitrate assimilation regulatory protein nira [Ophiostoma piceae UAMH 11346]|uniref:Nitrate assimilation regulatory protein nira n=1 Tax=Ophiostoma piceae (strain UAMH 11346) TaxID=1262450 RepID=S3DBK9_OPHP1|nr:nitrate assimilation regulatory protein nira [Ophiostoma piceae UAMH 11346]